MKEKLWILTTSTMVAQGGAPVGARVEKTSEAPTVAAISSGSSSTNSSSSSSSRSSIYSDSTSTSSVRKINSSERKKGRRTEAEKLLDSLSKGDPTQEVDSGNLRDRRTASGRSSIGPSRQSFHREGRSTQMLQHSTGINY
jgi:guanyl-specific ribonuclease Sa